MVGNNSNLMERLVKQSNKVEVLREVYMRELDEEIRLRKEFSELLTRNSESNDATAHKPTEDELLDIFSDDADDTVIAIGAFKRW